MSAKEASQVGQLVNELKEVADRIASNVEHGRAQNQEDFVVLRGNVESIIELAEKSSASPAMFDLSSIQPSETVRERNLNRPGKGNDDRCMVCGLPVDAESPKTAWVHMSAHGNLYPTGISCEDAEGMPEGSTYMHPVGPECAKKIPKAYK